MTAFPQDIEKIPRLYHPRQLLRTRTMDANRRGQTIELLTVGSLLWIAVAVKRLWAQMESGALARVDSPVEICYYCRQCLRLLGN
jgi:hypothetical protein